jgi:hypothetical protein
VPLDKAAAVGFINWLKPYLQFQSTLGWLKNPPPSYQQPAVDIIGGLDAISSKVSSNGYKNEYEFEAAVTQLMQQAQYVQIYKIRYLFIVSGPLRYYQES